MLTSLLALQDSQAASSTTRQPQPTVLLLPPIPKLWNYLAIIDLYPGLHIIQIEEIFLEPFHNFYSNLPRTFYYLCLLYLLHQVSCPMHVFILFVL